jgi:anti-anti-sigma factor
LLWYSNPPITVVTFTPDEVFDETAWDRLMQLGTEHRPARLLLDVQNISLPSTTAMTRLVILNEQIKTQGGKLVLCNVTANLNEVFQITKVSAQLELCADEDTAIEALID